MCILPRVLCINLCCSLTNRQTEDNRKLCTNNIQWLLVFIFVPTQIAAISVESTSGLNASHNGYTEAYMNASVLLCEG